MTRHRAHFVPWRSAGNVTESDIDSDDVVRETGWVFDNRTGDSLTLESFVKTGDKEVKRYMRQFGFTSQMLATGTLLEIGSGIGRMTSSFTQQCMQVIAADVDAGFLERCRETVSRHGRIDRLQTLQVRDGKTLELSDSSVDFAFSYITLQHCERSSALSLTAEAVRVCRDGGFIALNYRRRMPSDMWLVPLGRVVRILWRLPVIGRKLSLWRWVTRLGWQANRLLPDEVFEYLRTEHGVLSSLVEIRLFHSSRRSLATRHVGANVATLKRVHASHWWLVAQINR